LYERSEFLPAWAAAEDAWAAGDGYGGAAQAQMSQAARMPVGVSAEAAQLLERAYALDSDEKSRALYRDWAETYDETMLTGLNYLSPAKVADLLALHLHDRGASILDIGCGTGLAGQGLASHGFRHIDGLDISPEMMEVAKRRGVYQHFITADLNRVLDLPSAQYDGATCSGTFTHGHVAAPCLDEVFRILKPGAPFAFTVKLEVWESLGFKDKLLELGARGRITCLTFAHDTHYASSAQPDGVFCVYARA